MIDIDTSITVAELATVLPGAARTFEKLGIDYCCRGRQSLREAARALDLPIGDVVTALALEASDGNGDETVLARDAPAIIERLLAIHHTFTRSELERLRPLTAKVERVHAERHPELRRVRELFELLRSDLLPHMDKEEVVLFPYVLRLAEGERRRPAFGRVDDPIRAMRHEHEHVGAILSELERITEHYRPPAGACGSYGALYAGLKALQADIHRHVHLENEVLFPLALELESHVA